MVYYREGELVFTCDDWLWSKHKTHHTNYHRTNWKKYDPLDLLLVTEEDMDKLHYSWTSDWCHISHAQHILVIHQLQALTSRNERGYKNYYSMMIGRGYATHAWYVCQQVWSGAIHQIP